MNEINQTFPTASDIVREQNSNKTKLRIKIMQLRCKIKNHGFQKKGRNTFQHYDHYTIDDILVEAYPLLMEYNLATWYVFDNTKSEAILEVTDLETGYTDILSIGIPQYASKNANDALQNVGKTQTYLRKYLYIQLLDLSESDPDSTFGKPEQEPHIPHKNNTNNTQKRQHDTTQKKPTQNIRAKLPLPIRYTITELQERNITPTQDMIIAELRKQFKQGDFNDREYEYLLEVIQHHWGDEK